MTLLIAICVAVLFAVSIYLILGRELKEVAMGVFLLGHGANLGILAMSGQPLARVNDDEVVSLSAPVLNVASSPIVDPLPQALILTAIVISFAVMAFLLTLLVVTHRRTGRLDIRDLSHEDAPLLSADL